MSEQPHKSYTKFVHVRKFFLDSMRVTTVRGRSSILSSLNSVSGNGVLQAALAEWTNFPMEPADLFLLELKFFSQLTNIIATLNLPK
jgi:hypothetical protein